MTVAEAKKNLDELVEKVCSEGVSIELERDNIVVARLTPAMPRSPLTVGEFNAFMQGLPRLGDDADAFAKDIRDIRSSFPAETSPWD
jgi:antitoxin (DNA-binding transcriptional repressor) of toxin-antitoxin stability system